MKKKTNLQTHGLERATFDAVRLTAKNLAVKPHLQPRQYRDVVSLAGKPVLAGPPRPIRGARTRARLLALREKLEIDAYQTKAVRDAALGIRWGEFAPPDETLVSEATARLLEIAKRIERVDRLLAGAT